MPKDTYYFSHDYHARQDKKLIRLLANGGIESIGIFWCLVEMLYEEGGYLELSECDCIANELRTQCERIENVVKNFKLFDNDGFKFWSNSVLERIEIRNEKSKKAANSANNRWAKYANALPMQCDGNAIKEKKGKEIKEKKEFIAPLLNEVVEYFSENGYSEQSAINAFNYYSASNWVDSHGNQVRSWKQKMISVWFKPENIKSNIIPINEREVIDHRKNSANWK